MAEWNSKYSSTGKANLKFPWDSSYFGWRMSNYDKLCSMAKQQFDNMNDVMACRALQELIEEYKKDEKAVNALKEAYRQSRHSTISKGE